MNPEEQTMIIRPRKLIGGLGIILGVVILIPQLWEVSRWSYAPPHSSATVQLFFEVVFPVILLLVVPLITYRWFTIRGVISRDVITLRGWTWSETFPASEVARVDAVHSDDAVHWDIYDHDGRRICSIPIGLGICRDYALFLERLIALGITNTETRGHRKGVSEV
jgi:hypothetical protein